MSKNRRWITNVVKEAARAKIEMPWARGPRRAAMVARRDTPKPGQQQPARA